MRRCALFVVLGIVTFGRPLRGQASQVESGGAATRHAGPRIGLALSGGSARGLAHVGVLRALEREGVPIDAIAGTSMGSLVGGLYAAGYSAADLEGIALAIDWAALMIDAPPRGIREPFDQVAGTGTLLTLPMRGGRIRLPTGVIAGQNLSALFARLTWPVQTERDFRKLSIPFTAVATDIATGAPIVLDSGSLASVMRASMSLPSIFAPATLGGRVLLDGGLARNLPAQDVRALGAEFVICSDVSEPLLDASHLHSMIDVLTQAVSYRGSQSTAEQRLLCDVVIRPSIDGLPGMSFDRAAEWIARGDSATSLASDRLRALVASTGGHARRPPGIDSVRRVSARRIVATRITAASADARAFVGSIIAAQSLTTTDPARLSSALEETFASGLFETVTYSLAAEDSGDVLLVSAPADDADRVGFGFRYDDRYNAALLFDARIQHLLGFASTGTFSLRLGEQLRVALDMTRRRTLGSKWVVGTGMSFVSTPVDLFEGRRRAAEATLRVASAGVTLGVAGRTGGVGVHVKAEDARGTSEIAALDSSSHRTYAAAAALLWWDDLNRSAFPTRGTALRSRYERGAGAGSFTRWFVTGNGVAPLTARLSLGARIAAGAASRDDALPLHYRFFLGSLTPSAVLAESQVAFAGLRVQERQGFAVAVGGASLQWEAVPNVFVTARADVGNIGPTFGDALASRVLGAALSLGSRTLVGPVELRLHGRSPSETRLEFSVGHQF